MVAVTALKLLAKVLSVFNTPCYGKVKVIDPARPLPGSLPPVFGATLRYCYIDRPGFGGHDRATVGIAKPLFHFSTSKYKPRVPKIM